LLQKLGPQEAILLYNAWVQDVCEHAGLAAERDVHRGFEITLLVRGMRFSTFRENRGQFLGRWQLGLF
jgi:hypothetical protein